MAESAPELQKSLKSRHMTMISLGGVIGAGLFVGTSAVINDDRAGGGAVLPRRRLPDRARHADARRDGGRQPAGRLVRRVRAPRARRLGGLHVGWLYWYFWAIVLAIEAVAGATILQRWIDLPLWLMALALMALLTGDQPRSVKSFGEFEFWFASIKVVAIVAFIVIAVGLLLGIGGGDSPGLSNLTSHEGFAPAGLVTILSGVVIVIFAFVGAEIVTIAAAESDEPEQHVTGRSTRSSRGS